MEVDKNIEEQLLQVEQARAAAQALADQLTTQVHDLQLAQTGLEKTVESQKREIHQVQSMLDKAHRNIKMQYLGAVKSFSRLMELRSPLLVAHSLRVAELARLIAKDMNCDDEVLQDIYVAGLLHDIGKLGLDDNTLFKPLVSLNGERRVALMKHPMRGQWTFQGLSEMTRVAAIIRHHHERYDGQGFPDGLAEKSIPLGARILAVAEDYDELQMGWLAAKEFDDQQAQAFLVGASGKRYDPTVIAALPAALEKLRAAEKAHEKIMKVEDLHEGLVLARDFVGPDGFMWLSKDQVVSRHFIDRVREGELQHGVPLKIYTVKTANSRNTPTTSKDVAQPAKQTGHVAL